MNKEQTVKIDNYKAQYNKIISSIDAKNKSLEITLEETLKARTSLNLLMSETRKETQRLETQRLESGQIEEKQRREDQKLNERQSELKKQEVQLDLDRQIISGKKTEREKQEDLYIADKQSESKKLEDRIKKQEEKIKSSNKDLESFKDTKNSIIKDIKQKQEERNNQDIVLTRQIDELEILEKSKEREVSDISKVLENLYIEEVSAVKRTKMPFKMLVEREKVVTKKERDFAILTTRWRRFFKETFPGQDIKF